jgi:hypothetical protein
MNHFSKNQGIWAGIPIEIFDTNFFEEPASHDFTLQVGSKIRKAFGFGRDQMSQGIGGIKIV